MIATFLFCQQDAGRLAELLEFCQDLGGCKNHDALLVADFATSLAASQKARKLAKQVFREVRCISNGKPVSGWPAGPNSLFLAAATYISQAWKKPWLVIETDCVPLRPQWLDMLEEAYRASNAVFMGCAYSGLHSENGMPMRAMSGIAIYPETALEILKRPGPEEREPWDMLNREIMLKRGRHTPMIQHFYGTKALPPTFAESPGGPENTLTLGFLRREAVLFHRNKDGTLIRLLRKHLNLPEMPPDLVVVFPVCNKDASLLKANLDWMRELDGKLNYDALLIHDPTLDPNSVKEFADKLDLGFRSKKRYVHPAPVYSSWPLAPNHVFQWTARHMKQFGRPWFWLEADAWPLCSGWLDTLAEEYRNCGKPVMGPVVPVMNHVNGVAIYPADFCDISPHAMSATGEAWDSACRKDLDGKIHDAGHLIQHAWGNAATGFTNWGGNGAPRFPTTAHLKWLKPGAVLFHRSKDTTLITQLRKVRNAKSSHPDSLIRA